MDEIYECVEDVEPWMSGNARGPSTAFSLLHRLFTLKLSSKQVKETINHHDSPYIRAVSAGRAPVSWGGGHTHSPMHACRSYQGCVEECSVTRPCT